MAMVAVVGESAMERRVFVGAETVMAAFAVTPLRAAEIVAEPVATAEAVPRAIRRKYRER